MLILSDFLRNFRLGVKSATSKGLSVRVLADELGVDQWRLQKWEQGDATPKDDEDREALKSYFGMTDIKNIEEEVLKNAITKYVEKLKKGMDLPLFINKYIESIRDNFDPDFMASDISHASKNRLSSELIFDIIENKNLNLSLEERSDLQDFFKIRNIDNITESELNQAVLSYNKQNSAALATDREVIPLGKHAHTKLTPSQFASSYAGWQGLPMYNMPITASFIASYRDDQDIQPQYYLHDPRFRDCDFGAIITGDSMHAEIRHGDFVVCKEINDISFVVYGEIYYVVSKNGLETCKYLNADPRNENNFLLVPRNEKISPSPISKEMILKMYKVRGLIRGY